MRGVLLVSLTAVVALVFGSTLGLSSVQAQAAKATAWVEISSIRPAVGCVVDVSVELRAGGSPVAGAEITLALGVDRQVVGRTQAVTDASGVTYLGLDTAGAWAGAKGWMDVLVNGSYIGGRTIYVTEDGSCQDDGDLLELGGAIGLSTVEAAATSGGASLDVPAYVQQRNLSCEYASLTIATGAFGAAVPEAEFIDLVGWSANPHWGFRGDIDGAWGNTDDYGVYAEALVAPLAGFGFAGEAFYAQGDATALTARLDAGTPVVVWLGLWGDQSHYEYTDDGTRYKLTAGYHVVVAYAYDESGVWVSDPAIGDYRFYDWGHFLEMWNVLDGMGLAVAPVEAAGS